MVFQPKGETAQWRVVYDLLSAADLGEVVTYEDMAKALGMTPKRDRYRIQAAARKAGEKLLTSDDRAVEVVTNEGYRIVSAKRQIALAGNQIERASSSLDRGKDLATHVRLDELSEAERQIMHAMALGFAQVGEWARQIGRRVDNHDDRIADIEAELARLRKERH